MKKSCVVFALLIAVSITAPPLGAQQMKWKKLADRLLTPWAGSRVGFGAIRAKGDIVLAGMLQLKLSTDRGATWEELSLPNPISLTVGVIDIDIYNDHVFACETGAGAYYTKDRGITWTVLPQNSGNLSFDRATERLFIADGAYGKVFIYENNTTKIIDFGIGITGGFTNDINVAADGTIHAKFSSNIVSSFDHGATWIQQPTPFSQLDSYSFITDQTDQGRMVIVNEDCYFRQDKFSQLHLTTDGGNSWNETFSRPLGAFTYLTGNAATGCHDYFVGTYSDGILRSPDKGISWVSISGPSTPADSRTISALDDSVVFAIDTFGSVWVTDPVTIQNIASPVISGDLPFVNDTLTTLCDSSIFATIRIDGGSCQSSAVRSIQIVGSDSSEYGITDGKSQMLVLPDTVRVRYTPMSPGTKNGKLQFTLSDGTKMYVDLRTTVKPKEQLIFSQSDITNVFTDTIGGDAIIRIASHHTGQSFDAEFTIHYDTSYVEYHGVVDSGGKDHTIGHPDGMSARVSMNSGSDSVLFAKFSFYPVDSVCTTVRIDSITPPLVSDGCTQVVASPIAATICSPAGCGRRTLARFVRYGQMPTFSIKPNPTTGEVTLQSSEPFGDAVVEVCNAFGMVMSPRVIGSQATSVTLDLSALPAGVYYVRIDGARAGIVVVK